jgi:hypothetical protein
MIGGCKSARPEEDPVLRASALAGLDQIDDACDRGLAMADQADKQELESLGALTDHLKKLSDQMNSGKTPDKDMVNAQAGNLGSANREIEARGQVSREAAAQLMKAGNKSGFDLFKTNAAFASAVSARVSAGPEGVKPEKINFCNESLRYAVRKALKSAGPAH